MSKMKVIIIGGGGHGKVVAEALLKQNEFELIGFADDQLETDTVVWNNFKIVSSSDSNYIKKLAEGFVVAIGNNQIRMEKFNKLSKYLKPVNVIHPFSSVSSDLKLGAGSVILAGAVINTNVEIGENCIINSMALIDHDCTIGKHSHIGQASVNGSGNKIEAGTHVKEKQYLPSALYK